MSLYQTVSLLVSYLKTFVYFDQITYKEFRLQRNVPILLKSSTQTRHLKSGVNATIVFRPVTSGDNVIIQTYTFAANCTRIKLHVYDGQRIDATSELTQTGGLCGVVFPPSVLSYHSSKSALTMNYLTTAQGGDPAGGFNWTVMAYHIAPCGRDETRCNQGKCYPNPLLCQNYLSCSDKGFDYVCVKTKSSTSISVPVWAFAVIAIGVVGVVVVIVSVVCILRRKRTQQPPYRGMK